MEEGRRFHGRDAPSPIADNSTEPLGAANERVAASVESRKRKLLDLSKRNRALNFQMNKVSTIATVDEQPAEVFRQLYLREHPMRSKAAPEADEQLTIIDHCFRALMSEH